MDCPTCHSPNPNPGIARSCAQCGAALSQFPSEPPSSRDQVPLHGFIPRNLAGLISETLVVYREGFRVLLGIALLAQLPQLIAALWFRQASLLG